MPQYPLNTKPLYPPNWTAIAYEAKRAAGWQCATCHIQQGEDPHNNITTHHKDHNTFNNNPTNLIVLCQKCHLRLEGIYHVKNHYQHKLGLQLSQGQQILPGFSETLLYSNN